MAFAIHNRKPLSRYRPPPHRSLRPLPPRWAGHEDVMTRSPLAQFIILSMLLHAMAIMLFGAPSGGSREGRAMWGALDVVIRGPLRAAPVIPERMPVIPDASKEAAVGNPAIEKRPVIPEKRPVIPDASKEAAVGNPVSPPIPPLLAIPPDAVPERPPAFEVPPPSAPQPAPAPSAPPAPVVAAPVPQPPPAPIREIPALELPSMPRLERVEPLPVEQLVAPAPLPPPTPEKELAPIRLEALPRMEALPPPIPAPPTEALPSIERVEAPPKPAPVAEPPQVAPPRVEPRRVESPRIEPRIEAPAAQPSPFRPPSPATGPGKDEPSADYDPTAAAPALDAETLRKRAGELARQGTGQRAILAFPMPPIPARKSKMEEAIENARKPDCRTAYQSLGLAAVVPLIANQFGEGNCRW